MSFIYPQPMSYYNHSNSSSDNITNNNTTTTTMSIDIPNCLTPTINLEDQLKLMKRQLSSNSNSNSTSTTSLLKLILTLTQPIRTSHLLVRLCNHYHHHYHLIKEMLHYFQLNNHYLNYQLVILTVNHI